MGENIRSFLAVEISPEVRRATTELSEKLQKGAQFTKARPSWTNPDNFHFTIVFLGERSANQVERVKRLMGDLPEIIAPFEVQIGGLGAFPNMRNPRIVWIGVQKGGVEFGQLYDAVVRRLQRIRFQPDKRPYHPHLTLARLRAKRGMEELMDIVRSHSNAECGSYTAAGLTLFKSQLDPRGAIYTPLAHYKFLREPKG